MALVLLLFAPALAHWFLLPVVLCGILLGADLSAWVRRGMDPVDPVGLIAALGYLGLFLAPLLHVALNTWQPYIFAPADRRLWLGNMALINLVSVFLYRAARRASSRIGRHGDRRVGLQKHISVWVGDRLSVAIAVGVLVSLVANVAIWLEFGGLSGYVAAFETGAVSFVGKGWLFSLSEPLPILVGLWVVAKRWAVEETPVRTLSGAAFAALLAAPVMAVAFTGILRGSRSIPVITVAWVVGLYHVGVRRVSPRFLVWSGVLVLVMMYVVGFYKASGLEGLRIALGGAQAREQLSTETNRTPTAILLGDLGRADVQAQVLYAVADYSLGDYALGSTYVGDAASVLLPDSVWPGRPEGKSGPGTRALYGDYLSSGSFKASNIYGLGGEALLNFGVVGPPLAFAVLGLVVGRFSRWGSRLQRGDPRLLLLPFAVLCCVLLFLNDFDNVVRWVFGFGTLPIVVVLAGSRRLSRPLR